MSAAAPVQGARVTPSGFSVLPASAWSSVWASPTASSSTWAREDAQVRATAAQVAADESVRGVQSAVGTSTGWSIDSGGAASSRRLSGGGAGDCGAATSGGADVEDGDGGESEEEEKSEAAEEEEPPRDPKDRLPSLHRS
ncbi:hypothetical protein DYB35_010680 [Aphanomyces astaci]|uniref:Uncharacterized protein n=1 Tax=Aphanomyces astaci TaxID=112090 RepID=A0A418DZ18_APHAT|nr:hypothetical protein DYB35_010680 [Aphanomyces astaci]